MSTPDGPRRAAARAAHRGDADLRRVDARWPPATSRTSTTTATAPIARGSKDIFVNILTDTGLVQRYVTDWAGPAARVKGISIRLGVPCYAYDTLVFSGEVTAVDGDDVTVSVTGRGQLGDHVVGTVRMRRPSETG